MDEEMKSFLRSLSPVSSAYYKLLERVREENPFIDTLDIEYIKGEDDILDGEVWERINESYILVYNGNGKCRIQVKVCGTSE